MIIMGGTYSEYLIDPQPVPNEDLIYNFDMDSSTFTRIIAKNTQEPSDAVPWNLVFHSLYKIDAHKIGVLWYDYDQNIEVITQRYLRTTIFNLTNSTWKDVKLICNEDLTYRHGYFLYPRLSSKTDELESLLIFGGVNLSNLSSPNSLYLTELNFKEGANIKLGDQPTEPV